jgi:NAD(P)H dehydrogenase (quinone)
MHVFIVHAHPEPKSFNGALTQEATHALRAAGHEVAVSDLYAMGFNAVSDRKNFLTVNDASYFRQQAEEIYASENDGFAPDIRAELDKLLWCDVLIWQFPLWWFGLPGILKGWVDRVFAMRRAYGNGRYYEKGPFAGKRAMCSLTTGSLAPVYSDHGMNGLLATILFPINHGMLYFTGFSVVEPFVTYAPVRLTHDERLLQLAQYRERVLRIDAAPLLVYPKLSDCDENWVIKSQAVAIKS